MYCFVRAFIYRPTFCKLALKTLIPSHTCVSWYLERLVLAVPRRCLRFVIVVFPDHTHLLFLLC